MLADDCPSCLLRLYGFDGRNTFIYQHLRWALAPATGCGGSFLQGPFLIGMPAASRSECRQRLEGGPRLVIDWCRG